MPAVQNTRPVTHQPPGYTPPRRSESANHGRVERRHQIRSSGSVRVSRHQPRARIDQRPRDEHSRPRRRGAGREVARRSSNRTHRIRPEITILSVSPMSEHPAFFDGHKGAYIPPVAPPSYEQAMRTPNPSSGTPSYTDTTNRYSEITRLFPERHIVNSHAVTIPSYSESISQQLHPTVTFISSSSELIVSTNRPTFSPRRTRGIVTSQSDSSLLAQSHISARRDVRPTEELNRVRTCQSNVPRNSTSPKPPKPPRPLNPPTLPPKPKERKSKNRNNNSNIEDGRTVPTAENRQTPIVTQTMSSAANQNIFSLYDSPNVGASPAPLQAPLLPSSRAPSGGSAITNPARSTGYSNLDGLFSANLPPSTTQTTILAPTSNFSNLDGLGGAQKTTGDIPNHGGNNAVPDSQNLNVSSQSNLFMMSQSQPVENNSDTFSSSATNGSPLNWGLAGSSNLFAPTAPTSGASMIQATSTKPSKPDPPAKSLLMSNNDSMPTSQSSSGLIGSSQNFPPMAAHVLNSNMLLIPQGATAEQQNQQKLSNGISGSNELQASNQNPVQAPQPGDQNLWGLMGLSSQPIPGSVGVNSPPRPMKPELPSRGPPQPSQRMVTTPQIGANENLFLWGNSGTGAPILGTLGSDVPAKPAKPEPPSRGPTLANQTFAPPQTDANRNFSVEFKPEVPSQGLLLPDDRPVATPRSHGNCDPMALPLQGLSQDSMLYAQVGGPLSTPPRATGDPTVLVPMQPPLQNVTTGGQPPRSTQQSRKLPPPPRPSSGPKRAPSIRPTTAPPPRPAAKPNRPPPVETSLIEGLSTKPPPESKPEDLLSSNLPFFSQSNNSSTSNVDLLGPSLLDDPLPVSKSMASASSLLMPSGMSMDVTSKPAPPMKPLLLGALSPPPQPNQNTSTAATGSDSEPVYASLQKKSKDPTTSSQLFNEAPAPPSGINSLMEFMEPSKSEIIAEEPASPPPPLPSTRPPLEDFEDLFSPAEMNAAMAQRNQAGCSQNAVDDLCGSPTTQQPPQEDPYELVVEGLPHVKQTSQPPVLIGKKKTSLKSKVTESGTSKQSDLLSDSSDVKDVERRKSVDSDKSIGKILRQKSKKFRLKFSTKTEANNSKSLIGDSPTQPAADKKPAQVKPARPPPRPAQGPGRPTAAPSPTIIIAPTPTPGQAPVKARPAKPPPPKIAPMRSAPPRPTPNVNQNNHAAPIPTPKPRSNSKPDPPLKSSPAPKGRSVPVSRAAPAPKLTPSRAPPPKPPTKRHGNLRPPPAPKPAPNKPPVSWTSPRLEVEDGSPLPGANVEMQGSKPEVEGSKVTVVAMFDFNGGATDELTFTAGKTISDVTEVNPDWYRGQLGGKYGIFPKAFVSADIQPASEYPTTWDDEPNSHPSLEEINPVDPPPTDLPNEAFSAEYQIPEVNENLEAPTSVEHVEATEEKVTDAEIAPSSDHHVEAIEKVTDIENGDAAESTTDASRMGIALFPFQGQDEAELNFMEGDVIHITGEVNEDWLAGKVDGREGMFPAAFVQIGEAEHQGATGQQQEDTNIVTEQSVEPVAMATIPSSSSLSGFVEPMATGIQEYTATSSDEISFKVGDVMYLLERVDENWLMVQHDQTSAVGNVPLSHVKIVHPLP